MPWEPSGQFLNSMGGPIAGLPKKHVNVDTDKQPTKSQQTGGMLYAAEDHSDAINAAPPLNCPCCGQRAVDLAGATQIYRVDVKEAGGKSHKGDVPPCPLSSLIHPPMFYTVEPCGCRVSQEWAGAFSAELQSRMDGQPPKAVVDMTQKQRDAKLAVLEGQLSKLYALQAVSTGQAKEGIDYWIVIVADQIQRLCPGPHNMKPSQPLTPKVANWAEANSLKIPPDADAAFNAHAAGLLSTESLMNIFGMKPAAESPKFEDAKVGTPVYRMVDGTVSTVPAYPGQVSCGVIASQPTEGSMGQAAVAQAKDYGAVPYEWLDKQKKGVSPKEFQKLVQAEWSKAASEPEVGRTKANQWYVRFQDIYKVFVNKPQAEDYAHSLVVKAGKNPVWYKSATTLAPEKPAVNVVGGTPEEKAAYEQALYDKIIKGPDLPSAFTRDVAKQVLSYMADNEPLAVSLYQSVDSTAWRPVDLMKGVQAVRAELNKYASGTAASLSPVTLKYLKHYVDNVELPLPAPQPVEAPVPVPPPPPPPPPKNLTARKKRTIRYVED